MLNKALRIPAADVLYKLRLFIQDLFHQIQNESVSDSITVYLGQIIQRDDFAILQKAFSNNNLIAFSQFLFCSTDQLRAICVAKRLSPLNDNFMSIIIHIDMPANTKCATISSCRYFIDNGKDVLLNMSTMARIVKVEKESLKENQIASIYSTLVLSESQQNIEQILESKRTEIKSFAPLISLIKLMVLMNQQIAAEHVVETMFNDDTSKENSTTQAEIAACCYCLTTSCHASLSIMSPNAFELSSLYASIGAMYLRLDTYEKCHEYYQKALDSQLDSYNPDLNCISSHTNNIGIIFLKQGKHSDAISSFQRTLKILQQITEPHDTELALAYDHIGDAYLSQFKYEEALNNYNKSLEIQEHILPRNLSALSSVNDTLGNVYLKLGRSREALMNCKRSLEYQKEYMLVAHSSFAVLYNNIDLMYYREEQYLEALENYCKSLEIASISLRQKSFINCYSTI
ncbi:unnamed protein product [Rotaria socialis]